MLFESSAKLTQELIFFGYHSSPYGHILTLYRSDQKENRLKNTFQTTSNFFKINTPF